MTKYDLKVIWGLAKKHWRRFKLDVYWNQSHVKYYAKRIEELAPFDEHHNQVWGKPPLDPKVYPYDADKANAALRDVNQWIREDEEKKLNVKK